MKEPARTVPISSTVPWERLSRKILKSIWKDHERSRKMEREWTEVVTWSRRKIVCVGDGKIILEINVNVVEMIGFYCG